uniref:C2H2-type domain-containing protein n=1 Tax=Romanomermis culicivorax TaxID=13658 RepID=A0A915L987_ROMCU
KKYVELSSARSASPSHRESRRQRSRSASTPPKRSRRSASRCSSASKAASGSRRSASSRPPRVRRRSSVVRLRRRRRHEVASTVVAEARRVVEQRGIRPINCENNFSGEEISVPCLICPKMFSSPDEAYNHDIDAHGNFGRFPCILCTKFVACDPNKLQLHIETQHPARRRILKLACPFCHHNFSLWGQYNNHLEWEYSVRRRRVYDEIWHRSSLQCSLCGAEVGAVDRRDFENHARDCRALKDNGSGRQEQPQPCCTRRHAERRGCIHFRTFCKKYPGCSGAVCDFAHPTCKFDPTCRTKNCEWFHTATPRERCSMCGKNASGSSHDQSL